MTKPIHWAAALAVTALLAAPAARAEDVIKVGMIAPLSGPASLFGVSWHEGIAAYMKIHGDTVDGHKVEIIERDLPGPDPLKARALAQELIVKEGVQYLVGFTYTPNALAVASLITPAKMPTIIFTASTSNIVDKSPYYLRSSDTVAQISAPEALYVLSHGYKSIVSVVADYGPGWDAEKAFDDTFEKNGGKVVAKIRMPLSTSDYVPYIQRAAATHAQAIFGFLPGAGATFQFQTAYNNSGLRKTMPYFGQGETNEHDLPRFGDVVNGLISDFYYSSAHQNKENEAFKKALAELFPKSIANPYHADATAGMAMLYHMIAATHGKKDGDAAMAAVKGMAWEDIRGPLKVDPRTRNLIQNVWIRRVEKDPKTGALYNKEIASYPMQPDYGRPDTPLPTLAGDKPQILE